MSANFFFFLNSDAQKMNVSFDFHQVYYMSRIYIEECKNKSSIKQSENRTTTLNQQLPNPIDPISHVDTSCASTCPGIAIYNFELIFADFSISFASLCLATIWLTVARVPRPSLRSKPLDRPSSLWTSTKPFIFAALTSLATCPM